MRGLKCQWFAEQADTPRRIPYGMRGLKLDWRGVYRQRGGRIPYGMRGLKSTGRRRETLVWPSHPIRDAWIEIPRYCHSFQSNPSHPIRDAWIEINTLWTVGTIEDVASHTGCVD